MTDGKMELTRRKILGSLGAVGAAGAAAGFGTSALFSDEESFANNTLTAGTLDLKMDWEEHYSYPQIYGFDDPTSSLEYEPVRDLSDIPEETNSADWKAFPPGASPADGTPEPLLYVYDGNPDEEGNTDVDRYMTATGIDAYPDADNNGIGEFPVEAMMPDKRPCDVLADVPSDFGRYTTDEDGTVLGRTDNDDTRLEDGPAPLINLTDVKPGDFGEITFSTHLCDNPGYLWLRMPDGLDLDENGLTEPEADSDQEDPETVELADEVQTAIWYDNNCDNLVTKEEKVDALVVADTSETQSSDDIDAIVSAGNTLIDELPKETIGGEPRIRGGLMTFNGTQEGGADAGVTLRKGLGPLGQFDDDGDGDADIGNLFPDEGTGGTPIPHALDIAGQVFDDQGRPDANRALILVTDGLPNYNTNAEYEATDPDTGTTYTQNGSYSTDSGSDATSDCTELDETERAADTVEAGGVGILAVGIDVGDTDCDPDGDGNPIGGDTFLETRVATATDLFFDAEDPEFGGDLDAVTDAIAQTLVGGEGTGDEVIFRGTLREAEEVLTGEGIPLDANRDTPYDELDPENPDNREPFPAFTTACFGFSWWVPPEVGNQIQSDKAMFDLAFYAEQARNNDNPGQTI